MKNAEMTGVAMRRFTAVFLFAAVTLGSVRSGFGLTTTFTGAGDWHDPLRWSDRVPIDGDDAIVAGTVTNAGSTAFLSSYTLNACATHVFTGTNIFLYATNAMVSGTLTHAPNTAPTERGPPNIRKNDLFENSRRFVGLTEGPSIRACGLPPQTTHRGSRSSMRTCTA